MSRHASAEQTTFLAASRGESPNIFDIGFIADGVHVPLIALNNYLKCCGLERAFIVTDAISAAGMGPGTYELAGQQVIVDESLATWSADRTHLMGSAGTMQRSEDNLRRYLNLSDDDINRLLVTNPRGEIGIKV